jgi:endogenous inhibitor of DNA gyrase (YacG/DUF329 family)
LPRAENGAFPFCSRRCRTIDLGNWLDEQYRVPVSDASEDEDGALAAPPQGPLVEEHK